MPYIKIYFKKLSEIWQFAESRTHKPFLLRLAWYATGASATCSKRSFFSGSNTTRTCTVKGKIEGHPALFSHPSRLIYKTRTHSAMGPYKSGDTSTERVQKVTRLGHVLTTCPNHGHVILTANQRALHSDTGFLCLIFWILISLLFQVPSNIPRLSFSQRSPHQQVPVL